MTTKTKDVLCDGSRHAGACSGGDWDRCSIPQGPKGYAKRLRDGDMTDEDQEYEARLNSGLLGLLEVAKSIPALFEELTAESGINKKNRGATDWGIVNNIMCAATAAIARAEGR